MQKNTATTELADSPMEPLFESVEDPSEMTDDKLVEHLVTREKEKKIKGYRIRNLTVQELAMERLEQFRYMPPFHYPEETTEELITIKELSEIEIHSFFRKDDGIFHFVYFSYFSNDEPALWHYGQFIATSLLPVPKPKEEKDKKELFVCAGLYFIKNYNAFPGFSAVFSIALCRYLCMNDYYKDRVSYWINLVVQNEENVQWLNRDDVDDIYGRYIIGFHHPKLYHPVKSPRARASKICNKQCCYRRGKRFQHEWTFQCWADIFIFCVLSLATLEREEVKK